MAKKARRNPKPAKGVSGPCQRMHLDTEEKADIILAVALKTHPGARPMKQYDAKCKAWHVGLVK